MKFNNSLKISISTIGCLFLFSVLMNGQTFSFRNLGAESDIPSSFIYTVNQSDDGFLWVGTGNGIARFDGFNFYKAQYPDSVTSRYPTSCLKAKNGTLWFGCSDGTVFYVKNNRLNSVSVKNSKSISDIIEGPDGMIYIIPQGKPIFRVNPIKPEEVNQYVFSSDPVMFSASFTNSGRLLVGTQENILICEISSDSIHISDNVEGFDYSGVTSIYKTKDSSRFIIGTEGNGLFQLKLSDEGNILNRFADHPEWNSLRVQSISGDSRNNIWVSTFESGVIQFQLSDNYNYTKLVNLFNISSGLLANDVKSVFQDVEGNYWIGFFGEGISMLTSYAFSYYSPGKNSPENNIIYIKNFNDKYILGTPSGYHLFDLSIGKSVSFTDLTNKTGKAEITSYCLDQEKNIWIGTGGNGLFVKTNSGSLKSFYRSGDSGADFIKDIRIDDRNIWLATTNGVIVVNKKNGKDIRKFDINSGLPHNSISTIFISNDGNAYIATESDRLYKIDRDFNITSGNAIMSGNTINKVLALAQSTSGTIWAATKGNGIFECFSDSVSAITHSNDLMSNYCYSILCDSENNLWIGHEKGFSRYDPKTGIMKVFGNDFAKGGGCNPGGLFESDDRKVFIGTTQGVIVYDQTKDQKSGLPPFNNINYIMINDVRYPYQPSFSLPYNKKYVVRINYSGINFRSPEKVYYSTNLENFDNKWSKLSTSREVSYNLSDGKYKFNLISVNEEGLSQETPVSFSIFIKKPFWRTWWFILVSLAAATGIVILIIRERDKAQKKIQVYLEEELAARTSVVMKQKGEIELQNIEITDSINYAKRIQTSIFPDINKLKESFKDAFIMFCPRDIVSGDFYWFDKLNDDKFILVCADSTGHGVPGAFMSMIGSTLLQDIVSRMKISKPSQILTLLDKRIFSTLNQNVELGVSNDGMDLVVCEFDINSRHVRFASAMRPVIIVMDGEPQYIKGNRSSVGGEAAIEKYFDDQEYYLSKGDTIYLFSDGLPDQFGGAEGKKLKIARLKKIIEQISDLPMDQQKEAMMKFYLDWKGSYDQVDDILFMGVKV